MGKIKILPIHEAQKIAAGEIVERPANVVKELVENALDAGATHISVFLEEGGKKLISVVDNGCGMTEEDARLSIHNHATSKLHSVDDLQTITTFGFRGEALASIASVSQMTLITKVHEADSGIKLTIEHGTVVDEKTIACNTGTSLTIENLFYNLPARKKFLKKDETEWNAIHTMMQALSLTHFNCSFTLQHNNYNALHAPSARTLQERIAQLFDASFSGQSIVCSYNDNSHTASKKNSGKLAITGAISPLSYHRYDRNQLFFFVNNRWVKNQKLAQAVIKAYAGVLPERRYPAAIMCITIDPEYVDINIHPRKEEVQFLHPRIVEEALETMVNQALQNAVSHNLGKQSTQYLAQSTTLLPHQVSSSHTSHNNGTSHQPPLFMASKESSAQPPWQFGKTSHIPQPHIIQTNQTNTDTSSIVSEHDANNHQIQDGTLQQKITLACDYPEYRYIGTVRNTYIMIETDEGMVMIDQHAAHERILYEQFSKRFEEAATVRLMFPALITLEPHDYALLMPWIACFKEHGIILEPFSSTQYSIQAVPVALKNSGAEEIIKTALNCLHENTTLSHDEITKLLYHTMRAMMACKAAVKAGDVLDETQIHELIKMLHITENRMTCPHGRPTIWKFSYSEIERKFKRLA